MTGRPVDIAIVVGEPSGDQLGVKLMRALRARLDGGLLVRGVAGPAMMAEGATSLFPLDDIAVMGFAAVAARFRTLYARAWQVIDAVLAEPPDALVIIDSPDFTHAVAKRVRRRLPSLPIIDYVSPSVWAWRPGRAKAMRAYVDHVLALLPFEPEAHRRLGGPACTYVGHPLIERLDLLRPDAAEAARRERAPPLLVALPGSRSGEITRLSGVFGATMGLLAQRLGPFELVVPSVARQAERVSAAVRAWPVPARIVVEEADKLAAFRGARAALAASGTVTLELALAGVPMVGAYRVPAWEALIGRHLIKVASVLLPNIILGEAAIPEFLQEKAEPERLAATLLPLIIGGPQREAQRAAFARLDDLMRIEEERPSERAARVVLETIAARHQAVRP
jgi:lipid-A-disaccharide synthase